MSETKRVEVPFVLVDKFSRAAEHMKHAAERVAGAVEKLHDKFGEFRKEQNLTAAALLGVGFGLGDITEKVKETVGEFGRVQKSIAAFYASNLMWPKATSDIDKYDRGLALAKGTTKELHELSARFNTSLDDAATIYRKVGAAAGPLHLSQEKAMNLTVMAAAATKRWGISGEQAATTFARILQTRTVRGFDEMSIAMRGALGNIHKLGEAQVFEKLQKAMAGNVAIADRMSQGIGDSLHRIQSSVSGVFEEVAGPVFSKLSVAFSGWASQISAWAERNGPAIEKFGDDLVKGFEVLERLSGMILKHWKEIAAVWVGMKAGGLVKQMAEAMKGGGGEGGGAGGLAKRVGGAAALPLIGGAVASVMDYRARQQEIQDNVRKVSGLYSELAKLHQGPGGVLTTNAAGGVAGVMKNVAKELRGVGITETGEYDSRFREFYASAKTAGAGVLAPETRGKIDEMTALLRTLVEKRGVLERGGEAGPESQVDKDRKLKLTGPPIMNFNGGIHVEQKFDDADADRVFIRFKDDLEQYGRRPTQASGALPEGL